MSQLDRNRYAVALRCWPVQRRNLKKAFASLHFCTAGKRASDPHGFSPETPSCVRISCTCTQILALFNLLLKIETGSATTLPLLTKTKTDYHFLLSASSCLMRSFISASVFWKYSACCFRPSISCSGVIAGANGPA